MQDSWLQLKRNYFYAELRGQLCLRALLKNLPNTIDFSLSDKTFLTNILKNLLIIFFVVFKYKIV